MHELMPYRRGTVLPTSHDFERIRLSAGLDLGRIAIPVGPVGCTLLDSWLVEIVFEVMSVLARSDPVFCRAVDSLALSTEIGLIMVKRCLITYAIH